MGGYVSRFFWCFILAVFVSCATETKSSDTRSAVSAPAHETPIIKYVVLDTFPHPKTNFTEGLLVHQGNCYESTGSPDDRPDLKSQIGILNLKTGAYSVKASLDAKFFGEGIVIYNSTCYQLTYKNQLGFLYNTNANFTPQGQFTYSNIEGWGLTTDGQSIIMSDGTHELSFYKPQTFTPLKKLEVTENGFAISHLNELEYIKGYIYANIWLSNEVVKIDPLTGKVVGRIDFTALRNDAYARFNGIAEMNGIAYDSIHNYVLFTGKLWPVMYAVRFDL
jgi:glutamine cyclotransferase